MIDDDLYKIATDELNSDARKPDVWARACALASDDHDEARFLYTNLRVEEMLNKDGKQRTFSTSDKHRTTSLQGATASQAANKDKAVSNSSDTVDTLESVSNSSVAPIASSRAGVDSQKAPLPTEELDDFEIGDLDAPTSASGTDALSDKVVEFDDETMAEIAALSAENAADTDARSGIAAAQKTDGQISNAVADTGDTIASVFGESAANREQNSSLDHETVVALESATGTHSATGTKSTPAYNSSSSFEASAANTSFDSAPTDDSVHVSDYAQQPSASDVDAHQIENDTQQKLTDLDATAEASRADSDYAAQTDTVPESQNHSSSMAHTDLADADQSIDFDSTLGLSSELDTGIGKSFMVFNQHGALKAVKRGVSWPALFFTFPWLLSKALIGTALVYAILWLVSLGGLFVTANRWLSAGADASMNIKLWTGAFALLAIFGLLYIPFRYGNQWVAKKLQNRGFEYEGSVSAENKLEAVDRLIRYNQENS